MKLHRPATDQADTVTAIPKGHCNGKLVYILLVHGKAVEAALQSRCHTGFSSPSLVSPDLSNLVAYTARTSDSIMGYEEHPWIFKGDALYQLNLVRCETESRETFYKQYDRPLAGKRILVYLTTVSNPPLSPISSSSHVAIVVNVSELCSRKYGLGTKHLALGVTHGQR
jgi:hypothetical protein